MQNTYLNKGCVSPPEIGRETITVDGLPFLKRETPDDQRRAVEEYCVATFGEGTLRRKGATSWLWSKFE
jgi:hypothetical protein